MQSMQNTQQRFFHLRSFILVLPIALLTLVPLAFVLSKFLTPQPDIWQHLNEFILPEALKNTAWLLLGVTIGCLLLGVSLAWLTAVCDFPLRRFFAWALMLPLAMPAYVLAFVQIGLLDFTGPLQTWLRSLLGDDVWFPPIRSMGGTIFVLSLSFYPYVYLLARNAFLTQGKRALEAAQSLGYSPYQAFWKTVLPMSRPWIVGGLMLTWMETLADFGTVSMFNVDTFTTGIYKTWFALSNFPAANQLAGILVIFVLVIATIEQMSQHKQRYSMRSQSPIRIKLKPFVGIACMLLCSLVLLVAFVVPIIQLLIWVKSVWSEDFDARYPSFIFRSLLLAGIAALCATILGLLLSALKRRYPYAVTQLLIRLSVLGYAIPGTVLAVGVFVPIATLDNWLIKILPSLHMPAQQVLTGSLLVMILAYCARFLAVSFQPIHANMQRITRNQEAAARSLGLTANQTLWRLQLPMLRNGLLAAILMVFVDVMKEMPITLMTRPFGWDTLAIRVFEFTSEGMWERAALPSLVIVAIGLLPVILLIRKTDQAHQS